MARRMRTSVPRYRERSTKPNYQWSGSTGNIAVASGLTTSQTLVNRQELQVNSEWEPPGLTMVRVRGGVVFMPESGTLADSINGYSMLYVCDSNEPGRVPTATDVADNRVVWIQPWIAFRGPPAYGGGAHEIDVKAKVKFGPDDELRLATRNLDSRATTVAVNVGHWLRMLFVRT